ncbi:MAG: tyrosine-type recombinase/integrase [Gorillibacterium sp.]|nr:tyrosine-type recombinase/integrase [Gorillibacterium sp.]
MVNKILFTEESIDALPFAEKGGKRITYRDTKDRYLQLNVSHLVKTFLVVKKSMGRTFYVTLGNYPTLKVRDARKECSKQVSALNQGVNVTDVKQKRKQAEVVRLKEEEVHRTTLQEALQNYLEKRKLKPSTMALYKQLFNLHLSDWLELPASEISSSMVNQRHTYIATNKRQRPALKKVVIAEKKDGTRTIEKTEPEPKRREASADGTMRVLRAVLNYEFGDDEEAGISRINPVRTLSRKKSWYKVARRRTLIKNSDLPAWSKAVMEMDNTVARDFLLFILHTGLRRNEAAQLQWQQVDFEECSFTITDTKNKEPHTLPLSDYLHKLLKDRHVGLKTELTAAKAALEAARITPENMTAKQRQTLNNRVALAETRLASLYVFPGEGKTGHIVEPKAAIDIVTTATGIMFSCHDLRRTFATIAESLDLSSYTVKALLNHKQQIGDVTGGYIILNVDRLREPMQKVTDAIRERVSKRYGEVVQLQDVQ